MDALWDVIQDGLCEVYLSEFILEELARNLRKKARLSASDIQNVLTLLRNRATMIEPHTHLDVIKRKDSDNRILECAIDAKADVLVTGNFHDLLPLREFRGVKILTPRDFLARYFPAH
jgi:putative PIN family toxin of toxin-antitoxin system